MNFNSRLTHIKNSLDPNLVRREGVINSINSLKNAMSPEKISDGTYAKTVVRFWLEARDNKKGKDLMNIASIMGKEPELFSKYLKFDHNGYRVDHKAIEQQEEQIREDEDVKKYFGVIAQNMQKVVKNQKILRLRNAKLSEVKKIPRVTSVDKGQTVKRMEHRPGKVYRKKEGIPDDAMKNYMDANGVDIDVASINEISVTGTREENEGRTEGTAASERTEVHAEPMVVENLNNLPAPIQNENIFEKIGKGIAKLGENIRKIFPGKRKEHKRKKNGGETTYGSNDKTNPSWLDRTTPTPRYRQNHELAGDTPGHENRGDDVGFGEL